MKKKNLLTLGALCLSLGLVVSSCNQAGTEGPTGPTGPTGPQGEPGVPGTNGKTYKDVIVVNDDDIKGGIVTQDVYFVTEGEHDKVTFTFTPENEKDNIVVNFEINGVVVEDLDPTATSYTIEDADDYDGTIQVTGIEFTTVDAFGRTILDDAVEAILKSDKALNLVKTHGESSEEDVYFVKDADEYKSNLYSADVEAALQEVYDDVVEAIAEAVAKAKKDHKDEVKAQLTAIQEAAEAEVTKLQEAYTDAVADAKVVAKEDLSDLSEEVSREEYAEEDQTSQLKNFEGQIEAATTIAGLGSVINGATPAGTGAEGDAAANSFYNLKKKAFELVAGALDDVSETAEDLEDETFLTQLKQYGVDTTKLPTAVAEEQFKLISEATTLEVYSEDSAAGSELTYKKGQPVLGVEGADAVRSSVTGIKETILAAVKEKYHKEINESKALANLDATKTALLGVVDNAISNFKTADEGLTTMSLRQYVSSAVKVNLEDVTVSDVAKDGSITDKGLKDLGLIGYIEYMLANPVNTAVNTAFLNERIATAKATALATLKAAKDAIKDETYLTLTSYSVDTSKDKWIASDTLTSNGSVSKEIKNPFFSSIGTEDSTTHLHKVGGLVEAKVNEVPVVSLGQGVALEDTANSAGILNYATYNLNDWYNTLTYVDMDSVKPNGNYGTLYIQNWSTSHLTDFKKLYIAGLALLKQNLNGAIGETQLSSSNYTNDQTVNEDNIEKATGVYGAILRSGLKDSWAKEGSTWSKVNGDDYDYIDVTELSGQWEKLNENINETTEDSKITNAEGIISVADGIEDNIDSISTLNDGFKSWFAGTKDSESNEWSGGIIEKDKGFKDFFGEFDDETSSLSSLRKTLDEEITSALKGDVNLSSATSFVRSANLDRLYKTDVDSYRGAAVEALQGLYNGTIVGVAADKLISIKNTYDAWSKYLGHSLKIDTDGTWVVDDKEGNFHDYKGETISSVKTWYNEASEAIKNAKEATSVSQDGVTLKIYGVTTSNADLNKVLETAVSNGDINLDGKDDDYTSSLVKVLKSEILAKLGDSVVINGSFGIDEKSTENRVAGEGALITDVEIKLADAATSLVTVTIDGSDISISVSGLKDYATNFSGKSLSIKFTINHPYYGEFTRTFSATLPTVS